MSLVLNATDLCNDLISLGVEPRKTGIEKFIMFDQDHCTWAFIRGFFDADGNIRVYKRSSRNGEKSHTKAIFRITSNRRILEDMRLYFEAQGVAIFGKAIYPKEGCFSFETSSTYLIRKIYDKMYGPSSGELRLNRKYEEFQKLLTSENQLRRTVNRNYLRS